MFAKEMKDMGNSQALLSITQKKTC